MKTRSKLTPSEKKYLRMVRKLEMAHEPFNHRVLAKLMGWSSVANSWFTQEKLIAKGYLRKSERLAYQPCPVVTNAGQLELTRRAA
jgi:Mn-dependent DtxR family transcriptional regulator